MKFIRERGSEGFLLLLLGTDAILIVLHFFLLSNAFTGWSLDPNFSLTRDRGFAEVFQYVKEYWIVLMLVFLALNQWSFCYLSWGILFGYLLLDDGFQIHEQVGMELSQAFGFPSMMGLRPQDLGELVVLASVASILFVAIGLATYIADRKERRFSRDAFFILLALVFFGVVVDMIHIIFMDAGWKHIVGYVLGVIEEGGEMVVMSVFTWFVYTALAIQLYTREEESKIPALQMKGE